MNYKKYYQKHKERIKEKSKKYYHEHKEQLKAYYQRNKEKINTYSAKHYSTHSVKYRQKHKIYRQENKQQIKEQSKAYYQKNKEKINKYGEEYRNKHKKERREYSRKYNQAHKKEIRQRQKEYEHKKFKNDINYRLAKNLRSRLRDALHGNYKTGSAVRDLGCSIDELKNHLESLFQSNMSWKNYGYGKHCWVIDHIKPLSAFDLSDRKQFLKACNYKNLQPLWYLDNLYKSNKTNQSKNQS